MFSHGDNSCLLELLNSFYRVPLDVNDVHMQEVIFDYKFITNIKYCLLSLICKKNCKYYHLMNYIRNIL